MRLHVPSHCGIGRNPLLVISPGDGRRASVRRCRFRPAGLLRCAGAVAARQQRPCACCRCMPAPSGSTSRRTRRCVFSAEIDSSTERSRPGPPAASIWRGFRRWGFVAPATAHVYVAPDPHYENQRSQAPCGRSGCKPPHLSSALKYAVCPDRASRSAPNGTVAYTRVPPGTSQPAPKPRCRSFRRHWPAPHGPVPRSAPRATDSPWVAAHSRPVAAQPAQAHACQATKRWRPVPRPRLTCDAGSGRWAAGKHALHSGPGAGKRRV